MIIAETKALISEEDWVRLRLWYLANGRHGLPWRQKITPWSILLAETLLHRTQADAVAKLFPSLIQEFPSPSSVVEHPQHWIDRTKSLGLTWRSKTFLKACEILIREYRGNVPGEQANLMALSGVGNYAADAVGCFGFGDPTVLVDTNTIRLANRIAGIDLSPTRHRSKAVRETVRRLGPDGCSADSSENLALLDLAAKVCKPTSPRCPNCPVQRSCSTGTAENCSENRNNVSVGGDGGY